MSGLEHRSNFFAKFCHEIISSLDLGYDRKFPGIPLDIQFLGDERDPSQPTAKEQYAAGSSPDHG
jgi:hypothetical protein